MIGVLLLCLFQAATPARDPIFERVPSELVRAEAKAWDGKLEPEEVLRETLGALPLGARQSMRAAETAYRVGNYPEALRQVYQVLEAVPDLPPALTLLGTAYFRLQRYQDTADCFERLLHVAPGELWRSQALGHAYYSLGRYEAARDHYTKVVATKRAGVDALRGLGNATCLPSGDTDGRMSIIVFSVSRRSLLPSTSIA